jgi:plastocyanin
MRAVLTLAACLALAGCAAAGPSGAAATTPPVTGTASSTADVAPTSVATGGARTLMIQNFLFAPEGLTVAPGATVTVVNQDTANHTLTEKDHSFDTGNIPGNATGTFTAPTKAGTYPYICAIHPFMTGTLTVS